MRDPLETRKEKISSLASGRPLGEFFSLHFLTELFKQFTDNESFKRWLTDTIFRLTYESDDGHRAAG